MRLMIDELILFLGELTWLTSEQQGSRLRADYEVTWAKDGFFRNSRSQAQERSSRMPATAGGHYRNEAPRRELHISQFTSDDTRRKRFKVRNQLAMYVDFQIKKKFGALEALQVSQTILPEYFASLANIQKLTYIKFVIYFL